MPCLQAMQACRVQWRLCPLVHSESVRVTVPPGPLGPGTANQSHPRVPAAPPRSGGAPCCVGTCPAAATTRWPGLAHSPALRPLHQLSFAAARSATRPIGQQPHPFPPPGRIPRAHAAHSARSVGSPALQPAAGAEGGAPCSAPPSPIRQPPSTPRTLANARPPRASSGPARGGGGIRRAGRTCSPGAESPAVLAPLLSARGRTIRCSPSPCTASAPQA
jgi:hypothetical protein